MSYGERESAPARSPMKTPRNRRASSTPPTIPVWRSNFGNAVPAPELTIRQCPNLRRCCSVLGARSTLPDSPPTGYVAGSSGIYRCNHSPALGIELARLLLADAVYLFGDNSSQIENGAPTSKWVKAPGANVPGYTIDHVGRFSVLTTFRDFAPGPDTAGQRPVYVNTAALNYPGTTLGSANDRRWNRFDGVNDHLRGPGLGYPQDGDNAFTGDFMNAYQNITTRVIDGWVSSYGNQWHAARYCQRTYQFGIHITTANTWGMNFGSTAGQVDTFDFDSGVSVASTRDAEDGYTFSSEPSIHFQPACT